MAEVNTLTLKIQQEGNDDIRRISFDKSGSFSNLRELIEKLLQKSEFKVKYKDEDGDLISIDSDLEWTEAISYAERNKNILRLTIGDGKNSASTNKSQASAQNTSQETSQTQSVPSANNAGIDIDGLIKNFGPMLSGFGVDPNSPQIRAMIQNFLRDKNPAQVAGMMQQFLPFLQTMASRQGSPSGGGAPFMPWNPAGFGPSTTGTGGTGGQSTTNQTRTQTPTMSEAEKITKLVEMGYAPELSKETLTECGGNFEQTVQRLVELYK